VILAPAIASAAFLVVGWLCYLISGLLVLLVVVGSIRGDADLAVTNIAIGVVAFAALGFATHWLRGRLDGLVRRG
jgi:hypothetical protein